MGGSPPPSHPCSNSHGFCAHIPLSMVFFVLALSGADLLVWFADRVLRGCRVSVDCLAAARESADPCIWSSHLCCRCGSSVWSSSGWLGGRSYHSWDGSCHSWVCHGSLGNCLCGGLMEELWTRQEGNVSTNCINSVIYYKTQCPSRRHRVFDRDIIFILTFPVMNLL